MSNLYDIFKNFSGSYGELFNLLMNISVLMGVAFILWGLNALRPNSHYQEASRGSSTGGLWSMIIGACLVMLPSSVDVLTGTVFGATTNSEFGYASVTSSVHPLAPIKGFIRLFGVFAFMRGLFALRTAAVYGQNSGMTHWKGIVWVLSGTALVNLDITLKVMAATFGAEALLSWV